LSSRIAENEAHHSTSSHPLPLGTICIHLFKPIPVTKDGTALTMSFGFGISDFITVIQLAKDVRDQFVEAPEQYKSISDQ
jgi:hypothetical protein